MKAIWLSGATSVVLLLTAIRDHWKPGFFGQSGIDPAWLVLIAGLFAVDAVRRAKAARA